MKLSKNINSYIKNLIFATIVYFGNFADITSASIIKPLLIVFILYNLFSIILEIFDGIPCKERVNDAINKTYCVCKRCNGYYFGLFLAISGSIIINELDMIPSLEHNIAAFLLVVAFLFCCPTLIHGLLRRTGKIRYRNDRYLNLFGFLVGIAIILVFIGINSLLN